ncbi:MAG: transketolase C-terminal domain-containing protein [Propionibacteriaceae bacterium]|nr:transketolase C-terminal domain-containing protein [Propionibacteriaceae bacterium]
MSVRVLSMGSVKPLDGEAVVAAARETRGIVTVEEGLASGGLGGVVAEVLTERAPTRLVRLGLPDTFAPTGSDAWILDHCGMSPEGIAQTASTLVDRR